MSQLVYWLDQPGFGNSPFVYKTTDGGITWNSMNFTFSGAGKLYDIEFRTADDLVVVGNAGGVYHTSDNGVTWTQFNVGLSNFSFGFSGAWCNVQWTK